MVATPGKAWGIPFVTTEGSVCRVSARAPGEGNSKVLVHLSFHSRCSPTVWDCNYAETSRIPPFGFSGCSTKITRPGLIRARLTASYE